MTERIDKFVIDITRWSTKNASNDSKLISEAEKLRKWLGKHQEEMIPDGYKHKLLSIVELVFRYASKSHDASVINKVVEAKRSLCSCFLMMPEGKLVSGKAKKKVVKWLESLNASDDPETATSVFSSIGNGESEGHDGIWMVADITNERKLTLMKEDVECNDILEDIDVMDGEMLTEIERKFNMYGNVVCVKVLNGRCVEICNDDENEFHACCEENGLHDESE